MLSDPSILTDPSLISKYHVVFKPCSGSDGTTCTDTASGQSNVQTTLQDWVGAGGKFYVTDYSYDYIRQPWPGYVDWIDETTDIGRETGTTVSPDYTAHTSRFNGQINWVQIDLGEDAEDADHYIDPDERFRIAMARQ
jgi:hypothetical protein